MPGIVSDFEHWKIAGEFLGVVRWAVADEPNRRALRIVVAEPSTSDCQSKTRNDPFCFHFSKLSPHALFWWCPNLPERAVEHSVTSSAVAAIIVPDWTCLVFVALVFVALLWTYPRRGDSRQQDEQKASRASWIAIWFSLAALLYSLGWVRPMNGEERERANRDILEQTERTSRPRKSQSRSTPCDLSIEQCFLPVLRSILPLPYAPATAHDTVSPAPSILVMSGARASFCRHQQDGGLIRP